MSLTTNNQLDQSLQQPSNNKVNYNMSNINQPNSTSDIKIVPSHGNIGSPKDNVSNTNLNKQMSNNMNKSTLTLK
jgi:hypothetical protein